VNRLRRPPGTVVEVVTFPAPRQLLRRLPQLLVGIAMLGGGIGLMVRANLGLSPWDVLHQGISRQTGVDFGVVVILVGAVVLVAWWPLRQRLGLGTLLNTFLVGMVVDLVLGAVPHLNTMSSRVPALVAGVVVVGVGTGMYIGAGLGPGPRDGLMTAIAAKGPPIWLVRTVMELSALGIGWALSGNVGVGTVAFALSIGPLAHVSIRWFKLGSETAAMGPGMAGD
jgi:uncharacterized membrane protein YczE